MDSHILLSIILGLLSFFALHFVAEDILEFRKLRKKIQEELIFGANIYTITDEYEKQKSIAHIDSIRRFSAQLSTLEVSLNKISRQYFCLSKINLKQAAAGLMMYHNDFYNDYGIKTKGRHEIESALHLPLTYTAEQVAKVMERAYNKNSAL